MITFLRGKLVEALPTQVVVEVQGVGYEVLVPLSSYDRLPAPGTEVLLLTHLAIREDAHLLYGFLTAAERDLFRLLIHTVSGIGPKIALGVLSGMSITSFRSAVAAGDVKALSSVQGWDARPPSESWWNSGTSWEALVWSDLCRRRYLESPRLRFLVKTLGESTPWPLLWRWESNRSRRMIQFEPP